VGQYDLGASKDSHRTYKHRPLADTESRWWIDLMDAATADRPPPKVIMGLIAKGCALIL
jgi:hypothetical protein